MAISANRKMINRLKKDLEKHEFAVTYTKNMICDIEKEEERRIEEKGIKENG